MLGIRRRGRGSFSLLASGTPTPPDTQHQLSRS